MSTADAYDDETDDQYDDQTEGTDETPVIRKLRKELREARKSSKRSDELEAELFDYRAKDAFTAAKMPLNDHQRRAVLRDTDPNDPNRLAPDNLRRIALALEFPVPQQDGDENAADEAAQKVIVGASAGANTSNTDGVLTGKEFAGWDMARRVDFKQRHPDKFKALQRGESVRV